MESPSSPQNSKKRTVFSESSSRKGKEVYVPDMIHINNSGNPDSAILIDEKVDRVKPINYSDDKYLDHKAKGSLANNFVGSSGIKNLASASDNIDYADLFLDNFVDVDEYARLLAHFDDVDMLSGVEAPIPPIPWLFDPIKTDAKSVSGSTFNTKDQAAKSSASTSHNLIDLDGPSSHASYSRGNYSGLYLEESIDIDEYAKMLAHFDEVDIPPGIEANIPHFLPLSDSSKSNLEAISGSSSSLKAQWDSLSSSSWKIPKASSSKAKQINYSSLEAQKDSIPQTSSSKTQHSYLQHKGGSFNISAGVELPKFQTETQNNGVPAKQGFRMETEETIRKLKDFKQFDTVEDYSDHHYTKNSCLTMQKNWAKRIQEEWKILKKDLPDTIFVRVYETRMDLLRAVIVGAEGTPYHGGLFFFDVSFPSAYPNVPPNVYYHSGGLRLNPNLYDRGKVCLSLLNTWSGNSNERWVPGVSTMLQVLVSIQGLILNTEPYFNEPGYESLKGQPSGEISSKKYNEDTLILSLKTMVYSIKKPPKYFEDFVHGHFRVHAQEIVAACKAYVDGAQVGCLVKGRVQAVNGNSSSSQDFKSSVARFLPSLVNELTQIGAHGL